MINMYGLSDIVFGSSPNIAMATNLSEPSAANS